MQNQARFRFSRSRVNGLFHLKKMVKSTKMCFPGDGSKPEVNGKTSGSKVTKYISYIM